VIEKAALFGPVAWYILVMAVTPGPNNAMLAASGMNFGVRRTVPHILGVTIGVIVLFALCGLGLGVLFNVIPYAELTLAIVGSIYLAYLAWRIANAGAPSANEGAKPLTFLESFGFQFLNPKGWVMALTAATLMPDLGGVIQTAIAFTIVGGIFGTPCMAIRTFFGAALARVFQNPKARRVINWTLAIILLATIPFMFR
jgi:threonine/homoserine/homoserine lactone efflux protein